MFADRAGYPCSPPTYLFFFTDPAPPEIYTLSLHDALPISLDHPRIGRDQLSGTDPHLLAGPQRLGIDLEPCARGMGLRSEEHTSELQSHHDLVCRLLLEKKKNNIQLVTSPYTRIRTPHRRL